MADMIFKGYENYQELSEYASQYLIEVITAKPTATLCLATGETPELAYSLFVEKVRHHKLDVSRVTFVKLDEWLGIPLDEPGTCETFLRQHLLEPLKIADTQYIAFETHRDPTEASEQVERKIIIVTGKQRA